MSPKDIIVPSINRKLPIEWRDTLIAQCAIDAMRKSFSCRAIAERCEDRSERRKWMAKANHLFRWNHRRLKTRDRYYKNVEIYRKRTIEYRKKYPERAKKLLDEWRKSNKAHIRNYVKKRYKTDITHAFRAKLSTKIRKRIRSVNGHKHYKTEELIGCSFAFLRSHLESKFQVGMSWDNYGNKGWHIDHIKPCVSFNLSDADQQRQCFHYTNLQPLWARDNILKSDKLDWKPTENNC